MAYSATNIITWAKISQVLAFYDAEQKKYIKGGYLDKNLHEKIWVEWQSLAWELAQDPASEYLYSMGNYVFSLCFPYIFQAMTISGSGGTPATPVVPGAAYQYNEIKDTISSQSATYSNNDLIGGTDLSFILLNKQPLFVGDDFSFDNSLGDIILLGGNLFQVSDVLVIPYNQLI